MSEGVSSCSCLRGLAVFMSEGLAVFMSEGLVVVHV